MSSCLLLEPSSSCRVVDISTTRLLDVFTRLLSSHKTVEKRNHPFCAGFSDTVHQDTVRNTEVQIVRIIKNNSKNTLLNCLITIAMLDIVRPLCQTEHAYSRTGRITVA